MAVATLRTLREAWNLLNGVVCVYKPVDLTVSRVRKSLMANISRDMQHFEQDQPRNFVTIEQLPVENGEESYQVKCLPNLTDLDLVRGPAIEPKDLKLGIINHLGSRVSGVLLAAINDGNKNMSKMISNRPLAVYQIKGELGLATDTHWHDGKIWEKSTYAHLSKGKIDRVLTSIEATNQRKMFEYCGVDSTSQTAYELACQGLLRPAANGPTMIYSIKCIHFDLPYYTLELHAINEKADYLVKLIHDLGIALKTTSVCHQIRCIRYGHFKLEHALLRKHWKVEHLINNMHLCHEMLRDIPRVTPVISPVSSKSSELDRIP